MDWITGLQKAIDYIEGHLTEELDYTEIARRACSSSFHFQRVFSILCGFTLGEYIRNRRLALAGSELISSGSKVIDIALKYGYNSPESFCRAFTKFHKIPPSQAKENQANLKSFSRLSVKLILEGGTVMDYRIEKQGAIQVAAKKKRFPGGEKFSNAQISRLWADAWEDGTIPALCGCMEKGSIFGNALIGICYDDPCHGDYDYAIGAVYGGGVLPDGLSLQEIPAGTWAAFPCKGAMPEAFQVLWKKIYTEFFPTSDYQPSGGYCLEAYYGDNVESEDYVCEIWISVEKKKQ